MRLVGCALRLLTCSDAEVKFRVQDGELREAAKSSQHATVVLYVSKSSMKHCSQCRVIETGEMLQDEIVITVIRQPADSRRLRCRVFLGGAVR